MDFGALRDRICKCKSGQHVALNTQVDGQQVAPTTQVDWRETYESHIFKTDMPGLKKEEVRVQVLNERTLEISGERKKEKVQEGDTWHHTERSTGKFSRQFQLPYNSDMNKLHAQVQDGVLTVEIPKLYYTKPKVRQFQIA